MAKTPHNAGFQPENTDRDFRTAFYSFLQYSFTLNCKMIGTTSFSLENKLICGTLWASFPLPGEKISLLDAH